jgi:glyoxylase-like metal-dependent hydrolase (beta-lactamase superfamily II)
MPVINEMEIRGLVVGVFQENCYILASNKTKEAIIVDPGDDPERVMEVVKDMGVTVKIIANSHGHADHILGVAGVQESTGAKFLIHQSDLALLDQGSESARQMGREGVTVPAPDGYVQDGDSVGVAGLDLQVIHTPGHTPGSVSYYVNGLLFSGDTLFRGSIGRTDFAGGDYDQEMQSIVNRLLQLPEETIVLPGHMLETTIGQEKGTNPFILQELTRLRETEQ